MSDNLTITETGQIEFAQCESLPLPWWNGQNRPQGKGAPLTLKAATFPKGATIDEMRAAASMAWDAVSVVPTYTLPDSPVLYVAKDHRLIVRNDNGKVLGQASKGYKVHSTSEILGYFRKLCETALGGGWRIITLGALKGSAIIWAQAERDENAEILPGSEISHRLMLMSSFDGSMPTGCSDSSQVVVCNNTLDINWTDGKAKRATQRHRSVFDGDRLTAKAGIETGSENWIRNLQALKILADTSCSDGQARDLLRGLLAKHDKDDKPKAKETEKQTQTTDAASDFAALIAKPVATLSLAPETREHRNVAPIMALFGGQGHGAEIEGYKGTRYGLLQSCTEFVDHFAGRTYDTGRTSALFGQGAALKQAAFETLVQGTPAAALFA